MKAETREGLVGTLGKPHLRTHTSVLLGVLGSRPEKERCDPLIRNWMLSRCGQRRVVILQMWEASGTWALYSARPPPVSKLGLVSEFEGRGGEEAAGTEEGRPQSPGFFSCPRPKVCSGF